MCCVGSTCRGDPATAEFETGKVELEWKGDQKKITKKRSGGKEKRRGKKKPV
jgi:hypothetical protein